MERSESKKTFIVQPGPAEDFENGPDPYDVNHPPYAGVWPENSDHPDWNTGTLPDWQLDRYATIVKVISNAAGPEYPVVCGWSNINPSDNSAPTHAEQNHAVSAPYDQGVQYTSVDFTRTLLRPTCKSA